MTITVAVLGAALILLVLWEGFETIVLPRRVTRRFRLTRYFYRSTWIPWVAVARSLVAARHRETWLSIFGPLSLLLLLSVWAGALLTGFAPLHWATGSALLTLSYYFHTEVPSWIAAEGRVDNWQAGLWERRDGRRPADRPKRGGEYF